MNLVVLSSFVVMLAAILLGIVNTLYCIIAMGETHITIYLLSILAVIISNITIQTFQEKKE